MLCAAEMYVLYNICKTSYQPYSQNQFRRGIINWHLNIFILFLHLVDAPPPFFSRNKYLTLWESMIWEVSWNLLSVSFRFWKPAWVVHFFLPFFIRNGEVPHELPNQQRHAWNPHSTYDILFQTKDLFMHHLKVIPRSTLKIRKLFT